MKTVLASIILALTLTAIGCCDDDSTTTPPPACAANAVRIDDPVCANPAESLCGVLGTADVVSGCMIGPVECVAKCELLNKPPVPECGISVGLIGKPLCTDSTKSLCFDVVDHVPVSGCMEGKIECVAECK